MADKAGSALSRFLAKLPFKSPWKVRKERERQGRREGAGAGAGADGGRQSCKHILSHPPTRSRVFTRHNTQQQVTGVASSPEFQSYLPVATEYRKVAPA